MPVKGKGSFGYLRKQAIKQGIISLADIAFCAALFCIGNFWLEKYATVFTIVAVLGLLPGAKVLVSMFIFMKAEKFSCTKELYGKIMSALDGCEAKVLCGVDFYLTSYEKNYPLSALLIRKGSLIAFTPSAKCDPAAAEKHIEEYMSKNGISGITVKVFKQEDKFTERFEKLCAEEIAVNANEEELYKLMLSLSV